MNKSFFKKRLIGIIFCFLFLNTIKVFSYTKQLFPDVNIFFKSANNLLLCSELYQEFNSYQDLILFLNKVSSHKFAAQKIQTSDLIIIFKKIDDLENVFFNEEKMKYNEDDKILIGSVLENIRRGILCEFTMNHLVVFRKSLFCFLEELIVLFDFWTKEMNKDSFIENFKSLLEGDANKTKLRNIIDELDIFKNRVACYLGKIDEILLNFERIAFKSNEQLLKCKIYDDLSSCITEGVFCINSFFTKKIDPDKIEYEENLIEFNKESVSSICLNIWTNHLNVKLMDENFFSQIYDYKIPGFLYRHWLGLSITGSVSCITATIILLNWNRFSQIAEDRYEKFQNGLSAYLKKSREWLVDNFLPELMRDNEEHHKKTKNQLFDKLKKHRKKMKGAVDRVKIAGEKLGEDFKNVSEKIQENKLKAEAKKSWYNPGRYIFSKTRAKISKSVGLGEEDGVIDALKPVIEDMGQTIKNSTSIADEAGGLIRTYEAIIHKYLGNIANWFLVGVPSAAAVVTSVIIVKKIINSKKKKRYDKVSNSVSEIFRILNYYDSPAIDSYQADLSYKEQGLMGFYIDRLQSARDGVSLEDKNKLSKLINDLRSPNLSVYQKLNFIKLEWGKNLFGEVV
ncbi:hypothetical protein K9L05_00255 [Candidatus Babeliales bacterium]|nr:hypothetical protein [Candidatus Babeliales bacterium]